jgi:tape measure domain-containing protein
MMPKSVRDIYGTLKLKDEATRPLDKFENGMDNAKESIIDVNSALASLGSGALVNAISNLAGESLDLAIAYEQTEISFKTMLGGADAAKLALENLSQFSLVTPFTPEQVIRSGRTLLAFGFQVDDLTNKLKIIGDISAGTGKDFNELTAIFGKAKASGKLMSEDINQLTDAGIPIIKELAKNFGIAESQIKEMATKGRIGFKDLELAFETMTAQGGLFHNLMEEQSKSAGGLLSTIDGFKSNILKSFGTIALDALKPLLSLMVEMLGPISDFLKTERGLNILRFAMIALTPPILTLTAALVSLAIKGLIPAAIAAWAFLAPWIPFIAIALLIGAGIGAITFFIQDLITWLSGGESALGGFFQMVADFWNFLKGGVLSGISSLLGIFGVNIDLNEESAQANRAGGGPVSPGSPYIVGEEGAEMFVPSQSGDIVPIGGNQTNVTFSIGPFNVVGSEDTAREVEEAVLSALNNLSDNILRAETGVPIYG